MKLVSERAKPRAAWKAEVLSRDWEQSDADTQYLTHNIHRYSGKFIPQIARQAVDLLTTPGQLVVDPYCGSGTTLLECMVSGRQAIGVDLNPLAVLVAKAKVTPIAQPALDRFRKRIEPSAHMTSTAQRTLFDAAPERAPRGRAGQTTPAREGVRRWFYPEVFSQLEALQNMLESEGDDDCRRLGYVALSDILRRVSRAHSGYPNVMFDKSKEPPAPIGPIFWKRVSELIEKVGTMSRGLEASSRRPAVIWGDATRLPLADGSADAIVTHPPYVGSVPYAEYGALSLGWFGHDPRRLDRMLTGGRRQSRTVVERFEVGYAKMLVESARILKPGGRAFVLVGNPTVRGKVIDLVEMTERFAKDAGLSLEVKHQRKGVNRRANLMEHESLLFFERPT